MVLPGVYIIFNLDRQILQKCRRLLHVSMYLAVTRVATWTCVCGGREDTRETHHGSIVYARARVIIPCSAQLISIATILCSKFETRYIVNERRSYSDSDLKLLGRRRVEKIAVIIVAGEMETKKTDAAAAAGANVVEPTLERSRDVSEKKNLETTTTSSHGDGANAAAAAAPLDRAPEMRETVKGVELRQDPDHVKKAELPTDILAFKRIVQDTDSSLE